MAFKDTIQKIPFEGKTKDGQGFLPQVFRASTHILFLLACINDDDVKVKDEEAVAELEEALRHWNARERTAHISTAATTTAEVLGTAIGEAGAEYADWKPDDRTKNLKDLAQRIAQFSCQLDRELTGLRDSDPGTSL